MSARKTMKQKISDFLYERQNVLHDPRERDYATEKINGMFEGELQKLKNKHEKEIKKNNHETMTKTLEQIEQMAKAHTDLHYPKTAHPEKIKEAREDYSAGYTAATKDQESEWVSVDERLPEFETDVLLFDHWQDSKKEWHKDIRVGYLYEVTTRKDRAGNKNNCEWKGSEFLFNITHWQPLSQPPITK